jgi:fructokinase
VQRNSNSKRALKNILDSTPLNCLKVFDVNFREEFYNKEIIKLSLERADIVKMNQFEFYQIANVFGISQEWKKGALSLIHEFDLKLVIITLGENGSILTTKKDYIFHIPENKVNVVSTVGAGDAYTASVVMGWLNKKPLNEIVIEATNLASHVCGFEGSIPSQG